MCIEELFDPFSGVCQSRLGQTDPISGIPFKTHHPLHFCSSQDACVVELGPFPLRRGRELGGSQSEGIRRADEVRNTDFHRSAPCPGLGLGVRSYGRRKPHWDWDA